MKYIENRNGCINEVKLGRLKGRLTHSLVGGGEWGMLIPGPWSLASLSDEKRRDRLRSRQKLRDGVKQGCKKHGW